MSNLSNKYNKGFNALILLKVLITYNDIHIKKAGKPKGDKGTGV